MKRRPRIFALVRNCSMQLLSPKCIFSSTIKEKVRKNRVTSSQKNLISTDQLGSRVVGILGSEGHRRICTPPVPISYYSMLMNRYLKTTCTFLSPYGIFASYLKPISCHTQTRKTTSEEREKNVSTVLAAGGRGSQLLRQQMAS